MADILDTASAWLDAQNKAHRAKTVIYSRPRTSLTLSLAATIGRTIFEVVVGEGPPIRSESRDYLVAAADLIDRDVAVEPESGDTITETFSDGESVLYEVATFGAEPCWRWSDPYHRTRRIHTKRISGG